MTEARAAWDDLAVPWQRAFERAWESWVAGSLGIGAVLAGPEGEIIASGRNRIGESGPPGSLAGSRVAHAELDALGALDRDAFAPAALFTTLEPCVMCAGAMMLHRIADLYYAAADPLWDGLPELYQSHPSLASRLPRRHVLQGALSTFCLVLPLTWQLRHGSERVVDEYRRTAPLALAQAAGTLEGGELQRLGDEGGTVLDALELCMPRLWG